MTAAGIASDAPAPPRDARLLVVLPNWVGDVVMATPVLAALRARFDRVDYLLRPYVAQIVAGGGWHDETHEWPVGRGWRREMQLPRLIWRLRRQRYDVALLLTNSLRSALVAALAGIPRRVGYAREGRGPLLTDRLRPLRLGGAFVPVPVLPYYAALAKRLGCSATDRRLRLGLTAEEQHAAADLQRHYELAPGGYATVNPGAAFGAAKCWLPERFAEACDRLDGELGLRAVLVGAPGEAPLMKLIAEQCRRRPVVMHDPGTTLGSLKAIIRDAAALVCNDTGPRHYGIAFNVPTVTIFGPTYQEWTDLQCGNEIKLQADVPCGPCQLKRCPLDLRCQREVTTDSVMDAVRKVIARDSRRHAPPAAPTEAVS